MAYEFSLLKQLCENVPLYITLRDRSGRYVMANSYASVNGVIPRTELLGKTTAELAADTERLDRYPHLGEFLKADQEVERTRAPLRCDIAMPGEHGEDRVFQFFTYPVLDDAGEIDAIGRVGVDVTAEREGERELAEARSLSAAAFERSPLGVSITSLDGRFVRVNQALCRLLGYSEEELLERGPAEISHPDDVEESEQLVAEMLAGERDEFQLDKRHIRADGVVLWVSVHATLLRDSDGRPHRFMAQVIDISERRELERRLRHLADHDPLTGLLNRRAFEALLDRHVTYVDRYGPRGALLVIDLDHLKLVNDTLGHSAGDELIIAVAQLLGQKMRASDTVARLAGDEFAVLLPEADANAARHVAEEMVREISDHVVVLSGDLPRRVTASVGVTLLRPGLASGKEALVNADLAMYEAKQSGRDQAAVLHPGDVRRSVSNGPRVGWIDRIQIALAEDRFRLYAQPVVELANGRVRTHELLVRMLDEEGDPIPPGAFIYIAERYDLIQRLDRWVISEAIKLLGEGAAPDGEGALAINLSGKSLADEELPSFIEAELRKAGVSGSSLIFEVTETAAIANIEVARAFANRLLALGCRFALDDFGAGFGSFYYLKHIPFDYLKIDGEFVTRCLENQTDQLVIQALVGISKGMNKKTVAEGVESQATADFLAGCGVDLAQGYHVGEPLPSGEVLARS
ncbi:MAG: EAL domain-containing protein [Solirubrobacterales bacterium]|nr:EAL domain-containing protein [Solirubrobacterales bacterium]